MHLQTTLKYGCFAGSCSIICIFSGIILGLKLELILFMVLLKRFYVKFLL